MAEHPNKTPDELMEGDSSMTFTDFNAAAPNDSPANTSTASPGDGLFFADATLDLEEAHDFAETPEPSRAVLTEQTIVPPRGLMDMPVLSSPKMAHPPRPVTSPTSSEMTQPTSNMNRITHSDLHQRLHPPRSPPRRPRDIPWAVSFVLLVPPILLFCSFSPRDYSKFTASAQGGVFYSVLLAYGATIVLSRLLYRTAGGGDGDNARHHATRVLLLFSPISVAVYTALCILILCKTRHAHVYVILPFASLVKSALALRKCKTHQLFFQALVSMSLDIESRSLRRSSFYRIVSLLMGVQLCMVVWWKLSVFGGMSRGVMGIVLALVLGKWLTGTVARVLALVASGGIANWFIQQSLLMEEMAAQEQPPNNDNVTNDDDDDESQDYNVGYSPVANKSMPEEYRTADASIYQSVLDMGDEGIDDDFVDDDVEQTSGSVEQWTSANGSTCKSFLIAALSTSFGSVAQCGLLGGLAQFVWSLVRHADALLSHQGSFSRMQIGTDGRVSVSVILKLMTQANVMARLFVKRHSDLAMCHVAAYYKSYQKAATDVMMLVDASGVEPIIHDDMTTHVCSSVCGSISGLIVIVVGSILSHQRTDNLTDAALVQSMLLAFIFCYTLLFTVMEPLRASIKAIYVCFAQHPQSLSQAFPLIFHRLSRISEANVQ
jgi:hypothetical protein